MKIKKEGYFLEKMTMKELAAPLIKAIDSFNYLLKSHHRRTTVIAYAIGKKMGLTEDEMTDLVIAAAMHDIGALSVQERNSLIQEDVDNPTPHCLMAYHMLKSFDVFHNIAHILKHHHVKYSDIDIIEDNVAIQSHIIHLADRVDIYISPDVFILDQKEDVISKIKERTESIFHPDVFIAFEKVCKSDIFWININNMPMDYVLNMINFDLNVELSLDKVVEFAQVISRIVDYRSRYTATHSYTVGHLAFHLGKLFGLGNEKRTKLLITGLLHDIGKIGIDPGIIEKKGKLTDSEYNQVKLHSYYSGQILLELSKSEWFKDIVHWSVHHHEKVDGSGYPYGISGEEYDIGNKIIAYSDIIAALTEDRPYRNGMSIDDAFALIKVRMADSIDFEMYETIIKNKEEINDVVKFCQTEGQKVYAETYSI